MRENEAPATLTASDRARTVLAVPGRSSSSTWPPETSAARTSRISSGLPWTTRSTFSASRPARSIATASAGSSATRSSAGSIAENDTRTPLPSPVWPESSPARGGCRAPARLSLDVGAGLRVRARLALLADRKVAEGRRLHLDRPDDAEVDPVRARPLRLPARGREVHDDRSTHPCRGLRRRGETLADDDVVAGQVAGAADAAGNRGDGHAARRRPVEAGHEPRRVGVVDLDLVLAGAVVEDANDHRVGLDDDRRRRLGGV